MIFHCASEGFHIWCMTSNSINKLPSNVEIPCSDALKLITFLWVVLYFIDTVFLHDCLNFSYLQDYKELIKQVNSAHLWHKTPSIILVHNVEKYLDLNNDKSSAVHLNSFIAASLLDAAAACANKLKSKTVLLLMAGSLHNNNSIAVQNIIQLYMQHAICVREETILDSLSEILEGVIN